MPVAHPPLFPYSCDNQKRPNVPLGERYEGGEQTSPKLENYWLLINRKKFKMNVCVEGGCFSSGFDVPIYHIWFDQTTFKRFCLLENKAFNIYCLLAKFRRVPEDSLYCQFPLQAHIHLQKHAQYCLVKLKKIHIITLFPFLTSSNIWTRLLQFLQNPKEFSIYSLQLI